MTKKALSCTKELRVQDLRLSGVTVTKQFDARKE